MADGMEEARAIAEAAAVAQRAPGVLSDLEKMENTLISRVFESIREGKLTPEQAQWAWMELLSYRRLALRLKTKAKMAGPMLEKAVAAVEIGGTHG